VPKILSFIEDTFDLIFLRVADVRIGLRKGKTHVARIDCGRDNNCVRRVYFEAPPEKICADEVRFRTHVPGLFGMWRRIGRQL
jgi:hypothetical protein